MITKQKKLEERQTILIHKIRKRLTIQEERDLAEIIDIEYKLTMIQEGHACELD